MNGDGLITGLHWDMGVTQASSCTASTLVRQPPEVCWTMNERPEHVREIKLPKESEFRFELEAGAPIAIRGRSKSKSIITPA